MKLSDRRSFVVRLTCTFLLLPHMYRIRPPVPLPVPVPTSRLAMTTSMMPPLERRLAIFDRRSYLAHNFPSSLSPLGMHTIGQPRLLRT